MFVDEKKGVSHIEMILAFIIFIGFLVFALAFFNPLDTNRVLDSSLVYAENELIEKLTNSLESYSVVITATQIQVKFPLDNPENLGVRVEKENGELLESGYSDGNVNIDRSSEKLVKILLSEDFTTGSLSSDHLITSPGEYEISSSDVRDVISEKRAKALIVNYDDDYDIVRTEFNLPRRVDFSFSIKFNDGSFIEAFKEIPEGLEVVVKEERVETIRESENIEFADLVIKIW